MENFIAPLGCVILFALAKSDDRSFSLSLSSSVPLARFWCTLGFGLAWVFEKGEDLGIFIIFNCWMLLYCRFLEIFLGE